MSLSGSDRSLDWITFSLYICLVVVGWLMIYTVGYGDGYDGGIGSFLSRQIGRQTIWIGISLVVMLLIFVIDWKFWQTFSVFIYILAMLLLLAVVFVGTKINGARSWFNFFGFAFQPSEFAKFATCLALSSYLSSYGTNLKESRPQLIALGIMLLPMALIMFQPDAGSALVFISFLIMLYRAGMSSTYYLVGGFIATILILALMFPITHILLGMLLLSIVAFTFNLKKPFYPFLGSFVVAAVAVYLGSEGYMLEALVGSFVVLTTIAYLLWTDRKQRLVTVFYGFLVVGVGLAYSANYAFNNVLKSHQQERINVWFELCS